MAENFALAVACQIADRPVYIHADCKAAISQALLPRAAQLRPNRLFAGVPVFAWSLPGFQRVQAIQQVKAHSQR